MDSFTGKQVLEKGPPPPPPPPSHGSGTTLPQVGDGCCLVHFSDAMCQYIRKKRKNHTTLIRVLVFGYARSSVLPEFQGCRSSRQFFSCFFCCCFCCCLLTLLCVNEDLLCVNTCKGVL